MPVKYRVRHGEAIVRGSKRCLDTVCRSRPELPAAERGDPGRRRRAARLGPVPLRAAGGGVRGAFAAYCGAPRCVGDGQRPRCAAAGTARGRDRARRRGDRPREHVRRDVRGGERRRAGYRCRWTRARTDYNLDPALLEAAVSAATRFVCPCISTGRSADMGASRSRGRRAASQVIEDACQAHGADARRVAPGAAGGLAAFSFYPSKNLGAVRRRGRARHGRRLRSPSECARSASTASVEKYRHAFEGYTARLDTIQAIVLAAQAPAPRRAGTTQRPGRRAVLHGALEGVGDLRFRRSRRAASRSGTSIVVRTASPEALAGYLGERGIGTGRHYPEPPHLSQAFAWLGYGAGSFPVSRGDRARGALAADLPGHRRSSSSPRWPTRSRDYFG